MSQPNQIGPEWTKERVEKMKSLQQKGETFTMIARILGVSRNAVAGKLYRLGLCTSRQPQDVVKGIAPQAIERAPPGHCMWPYGDPQKDGFHFCGARIAMGRSYCDKHLARAYYRVDFLEAAE